MQLIDSNRRLVWATCKKGSMAEQGLKSTGPALAWLSSFFSIPDSDQGFDKFLTLADLHFPTDKKKIRTQCTVQAINILSNFKKVNREGYKTLAIQL